MDDPRHLEFFGRKGQFRYEALMLAVSYEAIVEIQSDERRNMAIEAYCIHARNLIEFFFKHTPQGAWRASAPHFTGGAYVPHADKLQGIRAYEDLCTQITHMSYERDPSIKIDREKQTEFFELIKAELANFERQLRDPYREIWNETKAYIRQAVGVSNDRLDTEAVTTLTTGNIVVRGLDDWITVSDDR